MSLRNNIQRCASKRADVNRTHPDSVLTQLPPRWFLTTTSWRLDAECSRQSVVDRAYLNRAKVAGSHRAKIIPVASAKITNVTNGS